MRRLKASNIIEDRHNNSVIILLYLGGRKSKTEIYREVSSNPRMSLKLQILADEGLIEMKRENTRRERYMVDLTPLGVKYAEGLCELERRIGGDIEELRREVFSNPGYDEARFDERPPQS